MPKSIAIQPFWADSSSNALAKEDIFMDEMNELETLTLTDEDGVETEFYVIGALELETGSYLALEPTDNDDDEYVILKVVTDENGEETLETIDDDDEFDAVADAFEDSFMSEIDFDDALQPDEDVN